ncbi:MAG: DUF6128 domain-containing protein [Roseburia sp.]
MPGMQRFISYLYLYENEEKAGNVGFAKIELRGEDCRIEVHLRGTFTNNLSCKIYLFTNQQNFIHGTYIGNMKILNGAGNFRNIVSSERIGPSEKRFADMDGLLILSEDERIFATRWKEGVEIPIGLRTFREEVEPPKPSSEPEKEEPEAPISEPVEEKIEEPEAPVIEAEEKEPEAPVSEAEKEEPEASVSEPVKEENQSIHVAEVPMRNLFPELEWKEQWEKMLEEYPVSHPFEKEEITCIRIELKDLRELPKRYWYLGNNSFLLHGFFNYHYLVVGKRVEDGVEKWFLGVPGVYQHQERVMAAIFGFQEFLPEAGHQEGRGEPINRFGYWCRQMDD